MNRRTDLELALDRYLAERRDRLPDRVLEDAMTEIDHTTQRRAWRVPWRFPDMSSLSKLVAAVATVVIVAVGGVFLLAPPSDNPSGGPAPSPSPSASPTPRLSAPPSPTNSLLDTSAWVEYTSDRYGFTLRHPQGWEERPAGHDWTFELDGANWLSTGQDAFVSTAGNGIRVSAWSIPLEPGTTVETTADVEAWVEGYCQQTDASCVGIDDRAVPLCLEVRDCHPGLLIPFEEDVQAFYTGGDQTGKMVVVAVWWGEADPAVAPYGGARRLLEGFLSTMCVWPSDSRPQSPGPC